MLVDLVDAGVDRADLDAFGAEWRDEARIGGSATGGFFRMRARESREHFARRRTQPAFRRVERLAAAMPVDVIAQAVRIQQRRAVLTAGEAALYTDAMPLPLSKALLARMENERWDTLISASGAGSTFLTSDAFDRAAIPIAAKPMNWTRK